MISQSTIIKYSQTPGVRNEIDKIFTKVLFIQRLYGQQILDPKWSWTRYYPNHLFTLLLLIYVSFGTDEVLKHTSDITITTEAIYTLIITSSFCVKCLLFIISRNTFQKLYLTVKTTLYEAVKEESTEMGKEVLKKGKLVVNLFFTVVLVHNAAYWLTALWFYITGARVTLSRSTSILMPMTTPYYEIGLLLHVIYLFKMAFTILVIDLWFIVFMFCFCIACDSSEKKLRVDAKYREESNTAYAKRLSEGLSKFYKSHVQLMEYFNALCDMYKWISMVPMCEAFTCICFTLLLISQEISWSFASNILPSIAELIAYNWLGEQIKTKAENLSRALVEFDWTSLELKHRKSYLIIVNYMSKEFSINTAVGTSLSFVTMTNILKASYQAFAVLQTMED